MGVKTGSILKYAASFALAGVLVYFAFKGVNWDAFLGGLAETRWAYVVLFVLFSATALVLREERRRAIIKPLAPDAAGRLAVWDAINVGNLVNVVLPGAGEFLRCGYVYRKNSLSYDKALGTVVCERTCDVLAILLLFLLALVFGWDKFGGFFIEQIWKPAAGGMNISLGWILAGAALLLVGGLLAVFHWRESNAFCGRVAAWIKGLGAGFAGIAKMERKWLFGLQTVGIWLMYIAMSWAGLKAIPALAALGWADALFISAVGNIASVIPVPGGIGAYHYLVALTLQSIFLASWDTGIIYATLCHETHAVLVILLGIISDICFSLRRKS